LAPLPNEPEHDGDRGQGRGRCGRAADRRRNHV